MNDDAEVGIVGIWCRHCDARPGEWCVTKGGFRSSYLHSTRFYDWREQAITDANEAAPVAPDWTRP